MGRRVDPDGPLAHLRERIGKRLREARHGLGMTQLQLSESLGVTPLSVAAYEAGTSSLRADQLCQLHELGVDVEALVTGVPSIAHVGPRREFAAAVAWVRQEFLAAGMSPPEEAVIDAAWMVFRRVHQDGTRRAAPEVRELREAAREAVHELVK
jgi:transcriptional regulator with XRE-family HTH domain